MSLAGLKARLAALGREMPALETTTATERNAARLARIAATPEGAQQNLSILIEVLAARGIEEPEDFGTLVDAIGPARIALAFPAGVPIQTANAALRARARAWFFSAQKSPPAGFDDQIARTAIDMFEQEAVTP